MLEFFQIYLPIVIYILLIALLIISIILGVRLINAMDKVDSLIDNVQRKVDSLDGLFSIIDLATDKISTFSDRAVDIISGIFSRFGRKKKMKYESEDEDYE